MVIKNGFTYQQSITVRFDYPVHFTRDLFDPGNPIFADVISRPGNKKTQLALVYIDEGVFRTTPLLIEQIEHYFKRSAQKILLAAPPMIIPGGEGVKNGWDGVHQINKTIAEYHLDRQSYIIAIGGGSLLDMVGFAASISHRGLRLIRVPTTTLAQNDAGVGVKNSLNENGQKNFIGTFSPPFAVLNDFSFLKTLDFEHWIGGVAEAFKIALIKDADFFRFLEGAVKKLKSRDQETLETIIKKCAVLHLDHIRENGDPFEFGSARPLDFGHWSAHKIESMSGYTLGHGQAVSIGMAIDLFYAMEKGYIEKAAFDRCLTAMSACGLPIWHEMLHRRQPDGSLLIMEGLEQFREHLGGALSFTVPDGIGQLAQLHEMDENVIPRALETLGKIHKASG